MCIAFLNAKANARDAGKITARTWQDYKDGCDLLIENFGKQRLVEDLDPADFVRLRAEMTNRWGPGTVGNNIQRIRVSLKFGFDNGLIDRPVRYGQGFKRPSKNVLRIHKAKNGPKLFTREENRGLLDAATTHLRAMILLGINCGFGNADCGTLPLLAFDPERGVIDYPRPKTGISRRCVLWPDRKGLGFYTLRHTFRTVADESKDQPAVDFIMGHEVPNRSAVYRETISDARRKAVTEHVRHWLWPEG